LYDPETIVTEPDHTRHPQLIGFAREGYLPPLYAIGHFSTAKAFMHMEVWRFVTFQFLHFNWIHLLFNMFGLWFVGGLVEQYLGRKRYAAFYLVCGIFGALMYLLLNLAGILSPWHIPGVLFNDVYTPLIGASAGVFGVLMAAAFVEPRATVYVYFAIPMRLKTAVYLLMVVTLVNLLGGSANAGGEAAHVGGALAGAYFIRHTHLLRDFFDILGNSHRPTKEARQGAPHSEGVRDSQVDRILEKVTTHGLASLTDEEKRVLRRASEARGA
jgi:membrane associated rhomboid family serine protease